MTTDIEQRNYNIFYSWQSDLAERHNKRFIRSALIEALRNIEDSDETINIKLDEATNNTSGSPHIRDTVLTKIEQCDFFIADVSSVINISRESSSMPRYLSNSNVMLELGYAIAKLKWSRIILICNTSCAEIEYLPFDVRGHKVVSYKLNDENILDRKNLLTSLISKLREEILAMINHNPIKPTILNNEAEIKIKRDLNLLDNFFTCLDIQSVNRYFDSGGEIINHDLLFGYDKLHSFYYDAAFHFYDKELEEKIRSIFECYKFVWDNDEFYKPHHTIDISRLDHHRASLEYSNKLEAFIKEMRLNLGKLKSGIKDLVHYVKDNYIEYDIDRFI